MLKFTKFWITILVVAISLPCIPTGKAVVSGKMMNALEDSRMVFYVVGYTEKSEIGTWQAGDQNKFVIVEIIIKNKQTDPLSYSTLFATLVDGQGYEYNSDVATTSLDFAFSGGRLASKDIVRGSIAFKTPSTASEFTLKYRDFFSSFEVELMPSSNPDPLPISQYIPQAWVGDTVNDGRTALTLNSFENRSWIDIWHARTGWKFIVVDVTIKNVADEEISYNVLYFSLKDSKGRIFNSHIATSALIGNLGSGELTPGSSIRGKIAFEVPVDETYFVLHYDEALGSFFAGPAIPEYSNLIVLLLLLMLVSISLTKVRVKSLKTII